MSTYSCYHVRCFVDKTDISLSVHQKIFHNFIFTKLTRLLDACGVVIHIFIFMNVSLFVKFMKILSHESKKKINTIMI